MEWHSSTGRRAGASQSKWKIHRESFWECLWCFPWVPYVVSKYPIEMLNMFQHHLWMSMFHMESEILPYFSKFGEVHLAGSDPSLQVTVLKLLLQSHPSKLCCFQVESNEVSRRWYCQNHWRSFVGSHGIFLWPYGVFWGRLGDLIPWIPLPLGMCDKQPHGWSMVERQVTADVCEINIHNCRPLEKPAIIKIPGIHCSNSLTKIQCRNLM